ncbi:hypothetical protein ACWEBX_28600 [Streptomyces sp. NPDC005070]
MTEGRSTQPPRAPDVCVGVIPIGDPSAKGTATMALTTVTTVSVDGVPQGHRRIDEGTGIEADARRLDPQSAQKGLTIQTYRTTTGRPRYEGATA